MLPTLRLRAWVLLCAMLLCAASTRAFDYGSLDASRFPPSGWTAYEWDDPGGWTTVDVTTEGLPINSTNVNAATAVTTIVSNHPGVRLKLFFPTGSYYFQSTCIIARPGGELILSGAGTNLTKFIINTTTDEMSKIEIDALVEKGAPIAVASAVTRGVQTLTLSNAASFDVGDNLYLEDTNYIYFGGTVAQFLDVVATNGNEVTVDMKVGVDMPGKPVATRYVLGRNCGFERLSVSRRNEAPLHTRSLSLVHCYKGFVRDCDVGGIVTGGIFVPRCKDVIVTRNTLHDTKGPISGTYGDGIMVHASTRIHVTANRAWKLRHPYWLGTASHCVIAYNESLPTYQAYGDFGQHHGYLGNNNLFEGNYGDEIVTDANLAVPEDYCATYYITFYRNRALSKLGSENPKTEKDTMVGNQIDAAGGLKTAGTADFYGANIIAGSTLMGMVTSPASLPPSLVYTTKPSHVAQWPLYGPGTNSAPAPSNTIPGLVLWWRFDEGGGTTLADSAGNGHTGGLVGDPIWGASTLNGSNAGSRLYCGDEWPTTDAVVGSQSEDDSTLDFGTNGFTVSAWIKPHNLSNTNISTAGVSKWRNAGYLRGMNEWALSYRGYKEAVNRPGFNIESGTNVYLVRHGTATIPDSVWTHLVGVRDGPYLLLYTNGALSAQTNLGGVFPVNNAGCQLTINRNSSSNISGTAGFQYTSAEYDEIQIYSRALSAADIASLYSSPGTVIPAPSVDADGDGIPDAWEQQYGGASLFCATNDYDHDGLSDYAEFIAGTVPTNPASVLAMTDIRPSSLTNFVLYWSSVSNRIYSIWHCTNLADGFADELTNGLPSTPDVNAHTVRTDQAGSHFYRVGVGL